MSVGPPSGQSPHQQLAQSCRALTNSRWGGGGEGASSWGCTHPGSDRRRPVLRCLCPVSTRESQRADQPLCCSCRAPPAAAPWSLWRKAGREGPALVTLKDFVLHTAALAAWAGRRGVLKACAGQLAGFTSAPEPVVLAALARAGKGSGT